MLRQETLLVTASVSRKCLDAIHGNEGTSVYLYDSNFRETLSEGYKTAKDKSSFFHLRGLMEDFPGLESEKEVKANFVESRDFDDFYGRLPKQMQEVIDNPSVRLLPVISAIKSSESRGLIVGSGTKDIIKDIDKSAVGMAVEGFFLLFVGRRMTFLTTGAEVKKTGVVSGISHAIVSPGATLEELGDFRRRLTKDAADISALPPLLVTSDMVIARGGVATFCL